MATTTSFQNDIAPMFAPFQANLTMLLGDMTTNPNGAFHLDVLDTGR